VRILIHDRHPIPYINPMKTLLASLVFAALLCGSASAADKTFPDTRASEPAVMGGYPGYNAKTAAAFVEFMSPPTHRRLLEAYAGKTANPAFASYAAREIAKNEKLGVDLVAGFEKLAADAVKAKDTRAATYRRAAEKLAQQAKESGLRADVQTAVADALKALEEAK
jgi:opacity protein-like surface antigen